MFNTTYTPLQNRIFRELCKTAGTRINQRTLAKRAGATPAAVYRALPALERDKLIVIEEHDTMNLKQIQLDRENHKAIQLKRVENLRQLYLSGLADKLDETYAGSTLILFGSYSRGEDTTTSDIDIAVLGSREKDFDLSPYQNRLGREIRISHFDFGSLSKEFRENLCNGIVLSGGIEL